MGFLKGFFVEEVPQEENYDFRQIIEDVDVGGAELDAVRTDTLIEDIIPKMNWRIKQSLSLK